MKYYQYKCDSDNFDSIKLANAAMYDNLHIFDGKSLSETWSPLKTEIYKNKKSGNFFMLTSHIPVVDELALKNLRPLIEKYVEFLPLSHNDSTLGNFYAVNVLPVLDCLDLENSDIDFYDDGRPMYVWKAVFKKDLVKNFNIFKVKDLELTHVFISSNVKEIVEEKNLHGLIFEPMGSE